MSLIVNKQLVEPNRMELAENRASGKIFVVLDDTGGRDFLVITPEGRVQRLERSFS